MEKTLRLSTKKNLVLAIIAAVTVAILIVSMFAGAGSVFAGTNTITWKGASDRAVAANINAVQNNTRKNASGTKITSNAHSADFPGIYFIWDSKQADNGYLQVSAAVFAKYESFVLTSKESNTYWDFNISVQKDQKPTDDGCYVFYIPKVYNNKNINMVFVSAFVEAPEIVTPSGNSYYLPFISGVTFGYDTAVSEGYEGQAYQSIWDGALKNNSPALYEELKAVGNNELILMPSASWIWNCENPAAITGVSGGDYSFSGTFNIEGKEIVGDNVWMYFAADNAIAVYINGKLAGKTAATFINADGSVDVLDGSANGWSELCKIDIREYLNCGINSIKIVARNAQNSTYDGGRDLNNSDNSKDTYSQTNNPGGIILAFEVFSKG